MENFPELFAKSKDPWRFDASEKKLINRSDASNIYGRAVLCVAKRQLSRRELRRHQLVNDAGGNLTGAQSSAHPRAVCSRLRFGFRRAVDDGLPELLVGGSNPPSHFGGNSSIG